MNRVHQFVKAELISKSDIYIRKFIFLYCSIVSTLSSLNKHKITFSAENRILDSITECCFCVHHGSLLILPFARENLSIRISICSRIDLMNKISEWIDKIFSLCWRRSKTKSIEFYLQRFCSLSYLAFISILFKLNWWLWQY